MNQANCADRKIAIKLRYSGIQANWKPFSQLWFYIILPHTNGWLYPTFMSMPRRSDFVYFMISLPNQTGNATMMRWIEQKMYFRWQLMRMFNQRKIALTQICLSVSVNEMKKDYNKNVRVITIIIPAFSLSHGVCC